MHDLGWIELDGDKRVQALCIAKELGHADFYDMPYLTTDRKKIIEYVAKYMHHNPNGLSVHAIACFSNNKIRRHVDYLV
ncbi:hypothetical protein C6H66_24485 [Photorhabdus hindustanensis]|uniref:Uncharacterized protein n=1 Tax=Photorhabdus hindustanensis TaxID=2918802 RepID=A0A2S8PTV3_9GAMM|nr:hypothetical protein C6H66_24485 [Photorhabdus hindustanensis]